MGRTAAGALGLTGQVDQEVYRALFGKLIAPMGERLYSGRPPRYAAETGRDKDEEAVAAVAALGEFATPAGVRRTRAKVLGSTGAAVPFYDLTFSATKSVSLLQASYAATAAKRTRSCLQRRTGGRSSRGTINRAFDIRCRRAGVRRITIHDTRRTCGSLLAALDVHPRVAMAILRHSRIALTMEIYTQVPDKTTRDTLKRLSDWLGQADDEAAPRGAEDGQGDDTSGQPGPARRQLAAHCCCTLLLYETTRGRFHIRNRPLALARSEGLEPPTF